jgi:hypothetical protein
MTPSPDPHCRIGKVRPLGNIELFPGVTRFDLPAGLQPDDDVIVMLARILLRAQAGEIRGVAMAWIDCAGNTASNWEGGEGYVSSLLLEQFTCSHKTIPIPRWEEASASMSHHRSQRNG